MKRLVRCLIAAPAVLIALLFAGPAAADRPHEPVPIGSGVIELPAGEFCDFTAVITLQDFNQYIISQTETVDPETGEVISTALHITGRARATVTNTETGESVSFNISGPGTLVLNSDGSFSGDLAGPNLLWTSRSDLGEFVDEVPAISYTTGHVTFAVTFVETPTGPDLQTTSYSLAAGARQTDVCAVLAEP